jgi:hypothetical protein
VAEMTDEILPIPIAEIYDQLPAVTWQGDDDRLNIFANDDWFVTTKWGVWLFLTKDGRLYLRLDDSDLGTGPLPTGMPGEVLLAVRSVPTREGVPPELIAEGERIARAAVAVQTVRAREWAVAVERRIVQTVKALKAAENAESAECNNG